VCHLLSWLLFKVVHLFNIAKWFREYDKDKKENADSVISRRLAGAVNINLLYY